MAKTSKLETYWRELNIDSLLKELTQLLTRRMPPEPAIAIVEYLQKKYPKSFKASTDATGIPSRTVANTSQTRSITSPHSDIHNESISDIQLGRTSANQSLVSGITTIPTMGSAFTDLLKQDTSSSRLAPEVNIRHLVFANRFTQQTVRLGKDICSDHDILEEEVIKPFKTRSTTSSTTPSSMDSTSDDMRDPHTHEEPTVRQIIKYKQNIRTENDRRQHREELANLAKQQREKEELFLSDLSTKSEEIEQQQKLDDENLAGQVVPSKTSHQKASHKPIVKSKEEEEILNDENVFRPRHQRNRERQRDKLITPRVNATYLRGRQMIDSRSTMKREDGSLVCKICGSVVKGLENQPIDDDSRQHSAAPTARSVGTSSAAVDDWFEDSSSATSSRTLSPWTAEDVLPLPNGSSTFRRHLFQPINNNTNESLPPQSGARTSTVIVDETKIPRLNSSRMSESGIFARSPETQIRRSLPTQSVPSPITKEHHSDTIPVTQPSPSRSRPPSTLSTTIPATNERRMSGWSVRENSPDASDEN